MEKQVYLIYECDAWLSKSSRVFMGLFNDLNKAIESIINQILKDGRNSDAEDAKKMLKDFHQTQKFETNYQIVNATMNEWGEV